MFSEGLLSAQRNRTFYLFGNSPRWGKKQPGPASASGHTLCTVMSHPGGASQSHTSGE